jgi:hypothetical protein
MKAITKKLIDEINDLLSLSSSFINRYNSEDKSNITPALKEDLLYFHKRCE